jgi:hypothetical protein
LHAARFELADGQVFQAALPQEFVATLREQGYSSSQIEVVQQF